MGAAQAFALEYERSSLTGATNWTGSTTWLPTGVPGAADRVTFTSTSGSNLTVGGVQNVGQMRWTGAPSGQTFNMAISSTPTLLIHGIGGVGIDIQSNHVATLLNTMGIAADQTWRVSNVDGGGFRFALDTTPGITDLGSHTLTIDLVNSVNTGRLSVVQGTGNLVKTGLGTLTLYGSSTFTGSTTIEAGTLALGINGGIAQSSLVTVDAGATFDVSGIGGLGIGVKRLAGSGTVQLGGRILMLTAANDEFAGVLNGSAPFASLRVLAGT
jgi:autotransporter-associated beta strand protein